MHTLREFLRRVPRWGWASFVVCAVFLFSIFGWMWLRDHLKPVIVGAGKLCGQKIGLKSSSWKNGGYLELVGLDFEGIAKIEKLDVRVTFFSLLRAHVDEVRIHGGKMWLGKLISSEGKKSGGGGLPFSISVGKLVVSDSTLYLDNLSKGLAPIPLKLAEVPPALVFNDLHFGGDTDNKAARERQVATIEHFVIYSPYDPAAKVLSFEKIHLEFTWAGLQQQRIEKLAFVEPIIYVGQDLFWLSDDIKKKEGANSGVPNNAKPWEIGEFSLAQGQIVLSASGQAALPLPGVIEVSPTKLVLGDFSQLHLETKFISHIPEKAYPEYNLKFKNLDGNLAFNLPLGAKNDRANMVRQFTVEELDWKGIKFGRKGSPAWVVLTFDEKGMYCKLGAPVSGGYVNGTVDIFLEDQMRWVATASAMGVNLKPITQLLSPDDFLMTGKVNALFKVNGLSREVTGMGGYAKLQEKGTLNIVSLQEMKGKLPEQWSQLKKDLSLIPMNAFERYDYTYGNMEFAYTPPDSFVRLNLDGVQGKRNFEIRWRDERSKVESLIIPESRLSRENKETTTSETE